MNSVLVKKKKQTAAPKASKTLKKDIKVPKGNKNENKKKKQRSGKSFKLADGRGVIYIGHIPHGFYEDEMKSYFNQFGKVTETAVARSKKTGRSRGFGFVEFEDKEVAKIAAETMNNYLMFNRIIKCRYIPPEERQRRVDQGNISASNYPRQKNRMITVKNNKKSLASLDQTAYLKKVEDKVNQFKKFFQENGIDFTFDFNNEKPKLEKNTPETKKTKKTSNNPQAEIKDDPENQFGVLEIDESDNEISFKTPPQVKKVIKKSVKSPPGKLSKKSALSKKIQAKKEIKINEIKKNKRSKKVQEEAKSELKSPGDTREKLERQVKTKVKKLAQPVMRKISPKKENNAVIKQKNLGSKKSVGVKEPKKGSGIQVVSTMKGKKAKKKTKAAIKKQLS